MMLKLKIKIGYQIDSMNKNMKNVTVAQDHVVGVDVD